MTVNETEELLEWMLEEGLVEKRLLRDSTTEWRITEKGKTITKKQLAELEKSHSHTRARP